jgi:hypothetical protein
MQNASWPDPVAHPGNAVDDREIRESLRVLQQQRSTKMALVIAGIAAGLVVLFIATWLSYKDEPDAAKTPSTQAR